jgi:hypothetical protein
VKRFLGLWLAAAAALAAQSSPAELTLRIPPIETTLNIEQQPVVVKVSGTVTAASRLDSQAAIRLKLEADLSDLQRQITPILKAQLNQDNRCGERLSIERAALNPDAGAGRLRIDVHYEKWACAKAFGKEIVKRLIGGNGFVELRLTPELENSDAVRLRAEVTSMDADGQLGEMLRAGALGDALREKIRKTVVADVEKAARLQDGLPKAVRDMAALRSVEFGDEGAGRLDRTSFGQRTVGDYNDWI